MDEEKWLEKECKKLKLPYCSPTYPLKPTEERKRIQTLRQLISDHRGKLLCVAKLKCKIRKRRKPSRLLRQMLPHQTQELTTTANETLARTLLLRPTITNESYHLPPQNFPSHHPQQESISRSLPFFESIGNSTSFPNARGNEMLFSNIHNLLQQYPGPMATPDTANVVVTNYLDIMTGLTSGWYNSIDRRHSLGEVYPRNTRTEQEVRHNHDLNDDKKVMAVYCNGEGQVPANPSETLNRSFSFRRKEKQKRSSSSKI
jgi:hypothetical protein